MKDDVLKWLIHGETGISSKAMAAAVCDIEPDARWSKFGNHPSDTHDFNRCVKFLDSVPEARKHMRKVAALSDVWARLVDHWDELEALCRKESRGDSALKLYKRMKELGC